MEEKGINPEIPGIGNIKKTAETCCQMIPEMFFDLICRILPGIVFAAIFFTAKPIKMTGEWYYDLPIIISFIYLLCISLDCFADSLFHSVSMKWSWKAISKHALKEDIQNLIKEFIKESNPNSDAGDLTIKQQTIILEALRLQFKQVNHDEKSVLIKILAEERFFKVTALGLPLFIVYLLLNMTFSDSCGGFICWVISISFLALFEVILFFGIYNRIQRAVTKTFFWWKLIK